MNALLLRAALLVSSLLALACSDDGSNQAETESIDTCSGHFICQSSDDGEVGEFFLEPGVLRDGTNSCNFILVGEDKGIHFRPNGVVDEGQGRYRWYKTDLGFVMDYDGLSQDCIASSLYKPGAFQKKGNGTDNPSSSDSYCRASGHFCAASSVCYSSSCNILSNTCN